MTGNMFRARRGALSFVNSWTNCAQSSTQYAKSPSLTSMHDESDVVQDGAIVPKGPGMKMLLHGVGTTAQTLQAPTFTAIPLTIQGKIAIAIHISHFIT